MIVLGIIVSIAAIGTMCWLLFNLAVFALPFFIGLNAGTWAYGTGVILPVLTGRDRRTHAAIFSFMAGVTPPMPMFGRSLL